MNKTQEINAGLEKTIDNVGTIGDKLYTQVKTLNLGSGWNDTIVEKIKAYLGFTKNYSDLAKTRLAYTKLINGVPEDEEAA